jgi:alpha-tubulin suppressor-like RCC1 family protein
MLYDKISSLNVTNYNNLGFVFVNNYNVDMLFIDNKPFINYNETVIIDNTTTSFIKYLVKKYLIKTIDFLACNLLRNSIWKRYFEFISSQNNVNVRASNDRTGNLSSGGDWILESTGENVEKIYFNNNIQYWNYLLDTGSMSQSTYIITSDNSNNAYSCGNNSNGELGIGSTFDRNVFTNISTNISGKKVLSIVGGEFHCMLMTNEDKNNLYSCGRNDYGQLGRGNNTHQTTFQPVTHGTINGKKIIYVYAGGNHSLILTNDTSNNLYSCGNNSKGQLGLGSLIDASRNTFTNITTNISGKKIINISAGNEHSLLLTSDTSNNLYSCGNNSNGELGIGNNTNQSSFQLANAGSINTKKILSISAGGYHSILLTNENLNNLYSCGENNSGQLGLGNNTDRNEFTSVTININEKRTIYISGGGNHSLILTNDSLNNLYSCGQNSSGQLGLANNVNYNSFQLSSNTLQNNYYTSISAGYNHSFVTTFDKTNNFYVVGNNTNGQLDLSNNTSNILKKSTINIYGKTVILNGLMNSDIPNTTSFNAFNYGTNNTTYYPTAQSNNNNIISISNIAEPESLFPSLIGTIGEAYSLSPLGTIFSSTITFTVNSLYLSNVYYQYNINSELLLMETNSNILPYYSYDGIDITIYTNVIFAYIVFTAPPSNTGAQFSNLNNLVISANDAPLILPNTRLNCTFFNTPTVLADISGWDISSSITMSSMFRDSSFNGEIANWKPKKVTDMSYMFYGANNFNKKLTNNKANQAWDVSGVTNMSYIFNNCSNFNNSQLSGGVTEPMYWTLNPNVNITNNVSNSALTVANAQTLMSNLLVYLNIGIFTTSTGAGNGTSSVKLTFFNEDGTVGDTNSTVAGPNDTIFGARYNIAGEIEWNYKISCQTTNTSSGPNQGSISSDLSRNVIVTGKWYNNNGPIVFYNSNDISNNSLNLNFGGNTSSTENSFIVKYNSDGFSQWRTRLCFNSSSSSHIISNTFCDSNGNIYATGCFIGQALFQDSSLNTWIDISSNGLNTTNQPDGFLLKYNKNGTGVWFAKISSLNSSEIGYQTIVDSSNNIYGTGYHDASGTQIYSGVLNLNGLGTLFKTIPSRGTWVSKYGSNGNVLWTTDFSGNIYPSSLGYNLNYDVYIGGNYNTLPPTFKNADNSTFTTLTDISAGNSYVTKYASEGYGAWTARVSDNTFGDINTTGIYSERQFQDIAYPQQGLKFAIYNGYFDNRAEKFGFFTSNYPYVTGVTSNLTNLETSTNGKYTSGEYRSVCWWGFFRAKKTGIYTFTTTSKDGSYLLINGNIVVNNGETHASQSQNKSGTSYLVAGTYYYIQIFYGNLIGEQAFGANYTEPGSTSISNATGLNTYFVSPNNAIGLYDNWINQPLGSATSTGITQVVNRYTTRSMSMTRYENYINLVVNGNDPYLNLLNRPSINPFIYKFIHFKYKIVSGTPGIFEIFYGNNNANFSEDRKVVYNYPTPINTIIGTWQNAVIDMTNVSNWYSENWSNYRLDPTPLSSALNIQLEYFFISDTSSYPMNEPSNNVYATGFTKGNNTNIYNSSFYYDTSLNYGFSGNSNSVFKSYTTNNSFEKTYIVKYNLNGQCQWSIFLNSGGNVRVSGINVDKTGNIYVFGEFSTTLSNQNFNITDKNGTICKTYTLTLNQASKYDTFIISYSGDGLYLWSTRQSSTINNRVISYGPGSAYYGPSIGLS